MRAFVCGVFGVIPVIGLLPAISAITGWIQVRKQFHPEWNPAGTYLAWGAILALIGILASVLPVLGIAASIYLN